MSAIKHAVWLTMSAVCAYLYLQVPILKYYSLQVFAAVTVLYLILQKRQKGKIYLILPDNSSFNLALINFAFLLLIGFSGSLASPFFAITFIELFFIALTAEARVAILMVLEIMVFHFSVSIAASQNLVLSTAELSNLIALPLVTIFYLFGRSQYEKAYHNALLVDAEAKELNKAKSDDQVVAEFINSLLNRRLPMLEFLLSFPDKNKSALDSEMSVLKRDLNLLTREISKKEFKDKDPQIEALIEEVETELGVQNEDDN